MQTYCLTFKKDTKNIGLKKVTMTIKVIRHKSRCADCLSDKLRYLKQKPNKKSSWNNIKFQS